jgi:nucleotide-binding universal stress UspA family protein
MFDTVLLPVDLNEESSWKKALPVAEFHVRATSGTLHVLTVLPDFGERIVGSYFPPDFVERTEAAALGDLETLCAQNLPTEISVVCAVRTGSVYREIKQYADETKCDLIVMASHRPQLSDHLLGANAAWVVRHVGQSVMVVRDTAAAQ